MDLIGFSIGTAAGLITGFCLGIYFMICRLKRSFGQGIQTINEYFKDTSIENCPGDEKNE